MNTPVILDALRTPVGRIRGGLSQVRADDLAALAIRAIIERTGIDPAEVDDVYLGCTNQGGEDCRNVARMAALLAGMPYEVPGVTFNRLCASSLEAFNQACRTIMVGDADLIIVGGVESMSRAPISMPKPEVAFPVGNPKIYDTTLGWRFPNQKLTERFPLEEMGETAENIAERWKISREDQDLFACQSHVKALAAQEAGRFDAEIIPVSVPQAKGDPVVVSADEGPRADSTLERLARLKPAFRKGGSVTAGNSSTLNDGATALIVASAERAKSLGIEPMARYVSSAAVGVDPRVMGIGPVSATLKALKRAGLTLGDIDVAELNEAFAVQALAVIRDLDIDPDKVNLNGGAIALGHPLGSSGARILTTLVHEMSRRKSKYGLATLCVGVGQGVATLVERA